VLNDSHATVEKDRYRNVLSLPFSFSHSFVPSSFSPFVRRRRRRRRRYRPFSFNYTTEAMIDTRLIVFVQKSLHASCYPMSATKCFALP
jgi:hypothetical protein